MNVQMRLDAKGFYSAMASIQREVPIELHTLLCWQMALVVQNIMVNIGVKIDEGLGGGRAKLPAQKREHELRIEGQLSRLFQVPESNWTITKPIKKTKGGHYGDRIIKTNNGVMRVDMDHDFYGSKDVMAKMETIHKKHRGRRGQVLVTLNPKMAGKISYIQKFLVKQSSFNKYNRDVQKHIGRTKASFNYALEFFSSKSKGLATWMPPTWVRRHGNYFGAASITWNPQTMVGTFMAGSNVPWARDLNARGKLEYALRMRMKDITSGRVMMKLKGKIEQYNQTVSNLLSVA